MTGSNPRTRSSVCWGAIRRCVPRQTSFWPPLESCRQVPPSAHAPLFAAALSERGKLDHVHLHTKEKLASIFENAKSSIKSGRCHFRDSSSTIPRSSHFLIASAVFFASRRNPAESFPGRSIMRHRHRNQSPLPSLWVRHRRPPSTVTDNFGGPTGRAYLNFRSIPQSPATSIGGTLIRASRPRAAAAQTRVGTQTVQYRLDLRKALQIEPSS